MSLGSRTEGKSSLGLTVRRNCPFLLSKRKSMVLGGMLGWTRCQAILEATSDSLNALKNQVEKDSVVHAF